MRTAARAPHPPPRGSCTAEDPGASAPALPLGCRSAMNASKHPAVAKCKAKHTSIPKNRSHQPPLCSLPPCVVPACVSHSRQSGGGSTSTPSSYSNGSSDNYRESSYSNDSSSSGGGGRFASYLSKNGSSSGSTATAEHNYSRWVVCLVGGCRRFAKLAWVATTPPCIITRHQFTLPPSKNHPLQKQTHKQV